MDDCRFAVDDQVYLVINGGEHYSSYISSDREVESLCLFFQYDFTADVFRSLITSSDRLLDNPGGSLRQVPWFFEKLYRHDSTLSPLLFRIRSALRDHRASSGWYEEQFHFALKKLLLIHRNLQREIEKLPAVRRSTRMEIYRRLHRAKDFIDSNFCQKITLQRMAGVACLSLHHFLRLFKQTFGQTPHQYLTWKRLRSVENLLLKTEEPITKICLEVGFESLSSFSTLFRRHTGVSPREFRLRKTRKT